MHFFFVDPTTDLNEEKTKCYFILLNQFNQMLMNVWMETCTTAQMSSTSVSTLAALTSVNANKICTLLMANAEVISDKYA